VVLEVVVASQATVSSNARVVPRCNVRYRRGPRPGS
jgi:hypothetical protein